jgi:release factor glutamine methyltransferase
LAQVLGMPRLKLYLNFEQKLGEPELEKMRELVKRRGAREPLQHLLGKTAFGELEIEVNRAVLIPRPETELLAERAGRFLAGVTVEKPRALDWGTGSGCLAISLARQCPAAEVVALDVSAEALAVARQNATRNGVADRVTFLQGDGFAALNGEAGPFHLVVSNPPYIASAEIATLEPEVRDYDPRLALDGGVDGLDFYRRLAAEAGAFLAAEGCLMLELGAGQAGAVGELFKGQMWVVEAVERDYGKHERIMVVRKAP